MSDEGKTGAKLTALPGGGCPDNLKQELRKYQESLPLMVEYQVALAKVQWSRYTALVEEGFTEAQAIELCKGME